MVVLFVCMIFCVYVHVILCRSDLAGQVLPFLGMDWTQNGVVSQFAAGLTQESISIIICDCRWSCSMLSPRMATRLLICLPVPLARRATLRSF